MSNDNAGIDWGQFGQANRVQVDGVTYHYGVIPAHDVLQAWADSAEGVYPEFDDDFYGADDVCDICELTFSAHTEHYGCADDDVCEICGAVATHDFVNERAQEIFDSCAEASGFILDDSEYDASQSADDSDIFITRSAYFTFSAFCSPCAPGAGYLRDARSADNGIRAFCFAHDWFDSGFAPYGVWRVDNGALVLPNNPHAGMLRFELRDDFAHWIAEWREFNAAIIGYADKWGTKQESGAAQAYVAALESAFCAGGYNAVVALGAFEKMTWCE